MEMTTEDITEEIEGPADPTADDLEGGEIVDGGTDDADDDAEDDTDDDTGATPASETPEPLDELEAEELEMLTDDETSETLVVDEAAEMREIRRAQIAMEGEGASEAAADEFVCTNCFLVKKVSQLADKRRRICTDCAA